MLSITQVQKNVFDAATNSKYKRTPNGKTLGRIQTIVVPCEELTGNCLVAEEIQSVLIGEASKLASRIAVLNGDTRLVNENSDETETQIDEENVRHYLEHCLPVVNRSVRAQIVTGDSDAENRKNTVSKEDEERSVDDANCTTCHCREITDKENKTQTTMIHEWSQDNLEKFVYTMHGREHRHVIFTHPCCRGDIEVQVPNGDEPISMSAPDAPPMPSTADARRLSAATKSLLVENKKSLPFMNELVHKISMCQAEKPLCSETIEQRVDRLRLERITKQEELRRNQIQEYNRLIIDTKLSLGSHRKTTEPSNKKAADNDDEKEDEETSTDGSSSTCDEQSLQSDEESTDEDNDKEKQTPLKTDEKICNFLFSYKFSKHSQRKKPSKVLVIGDFNGWNRDTAFTLQELGSTGVHVYLASIPAGTYEYSFIVDERSEINQSKPMRNGLNVCTVVYNELLAELKEEEVQKAKLNAEQANLSSSSSEHESSDSSDSGTIDSNESDNSEGSSTITDTSSDESSDEKDKAIMDQTKNDEKTNEAPIAKVLEDVQPIDKLVKENYAKNKSTAVKQFCADFMLAICESKDEFSFFAKLNCPYILQWADERKNTIHIFRRFYQNYSSWFRRSRTTHFQLLATLRACN